MTGRITRRGFAAVAAGAAAVIALPSLQAQVRPERARVSIAVSGKAALHNLPLTIADQLDYFRAEGLEVDIVDGVGGARAGQQAAAGVADVVSGPYEHTITLQAKGQFFQAFVLQSRAPQIAMGISNRSFPAYHGVTDLRGRRIGVSAPESSSHMVANLVLARAGVKPSEVSFISVGTAAGAVAALRASQIDAMCNTDPVMTMLEQKGDVRIISDTRTLKGSAEVFGGPMPAACLYAPIEFVQKNPNTCQALAHAIVHGLKWLQTAGPSDIIKTVPEAYLLGDRALYLASFAKVREAISPDGMLPEDGPRTALMALASLELAVRPDRIELARTFTNDFARRAKERFKI